MSYKCN